MTFIDAVSEILRQAGGALAPKEIRDRLKVNHPEFYGTESHRANFAKGHYNSLDHALMAQVYGLAKRDIFVVDKTVRPMKLALRDELASESEAEVVSVEDFESDVGIVYVLSTGNFTKDGREHIKIGSTAREIEQRITELYTTGVHRRFTVRHTYRVSGFMELEKVLHTLLQKFRLSSAREFFTEDAVPYIERIVSLHREINEPNPPVTTAASSER